LNAPAPRESHFLSLIRRHGPLSRKELHELTGLRPNTVGEIAAAMLDRRLLREGESESVGVGRPRQLLEIDPDRLHVIGIAFEPGRVSSCRLGLQGQVQGTIRQQVVDDPEHLVAAAADMVRELSNDQTLGVALSTTGFVDPQTRSILTSSATMRQTPTRLDSVYAAAADHPIVVENDMHARATYWLLNQDTGASDAVTRQDILLIDLRDGAIGAALLVGGRPNRGCVIGGNELGHMRFLVDTEVCFCGQTGCLEKIFSSPFLRKIGGSENADLQTRLENAGQGDAAVGQISDYVAMGIANAINFIRPDRVVIAGKILSAEAWCLNLVQSVRKLLLRPLEERVRIGLWDKTSIQSAEAAAWLALGDVFRGGQVDETAVQSEAETAIHSQEDSGEMQAKV
jgi:predicted NBD/HSP70 family sugar kinase